MVVGIRELSRDTSRIIKEFELTGEAVVVTREGRPIGALVAVDQRRLEDIVLATAPEFVERRRRAEAEVRQGETRSLEDVAAERGIVLPAESQLENDVTRLAKESTEQQLSSLDEMLAPDLLREIKDEVSNQVATLSAGMIERVHQHAGEELTASDIEEMVELNAAISAALVRQDISLVVTSGRHDFAERITEIVSSLAERIVGSVTGDLPKTAIGEAEEIPMVAACKVFLAGMKSGSDLAHAEPTYWGSSQVRVR